MSDWVTGIKVLGIRRYVWSRFFYRGFSRLIHKFDLHYAPEIGPFEDGATQLWCMWCGFRMTNPPSAVPEQEVAK